MPSKKTSAPSETLDSEEKTFRLIFETHAAIMLLIEPHSGVILDANQAAVIFYKYPKSQLCGMLIDDINILPPEQVAEELQRALNAERNYFVFPHKLADGEERIVEVHSSVILLQERQVLFSIIHDVTERKHMEQELQIQRDFATQIINTMGQGLTVTDENGRFEFVNPAYARMFGYESKDLIGKSPEDVTAAEDKMALNAQRSARQAGKTTAYESRLRRADGSNAHVLITGVPRGAKGKYKGSIAVITDLTEQKRIEDELRRAKDALETTNHKLEEALAREQQLARTDSLTGINNRRSLFELAEHEFDISLRYQQPFSMMLFDVDYFKQINDTFGHPVGDEALKNITRAVSAEIRSVDMMGRYGGDEFVVLLTQTDAQGALPLAERIHARIAAMRMDTHKGPLTLTISIGIAQANYHCGQPPRSDTVENLFLRADQALYSSKQAGRNRTMVFDT